MFVSFLWYNFKYNENLIIADRKGVIKTIPFNSLNKEKIEFTDIENNLNFEDYLYIYDDDNFILEDNRAKIGAEAVAALLAARHASEMALRRLSERCTRALHGGEPD